MPIMNATTPRFRRDDSTGLRRVAVRCAGLVLAGLVVMPLDPAVAGWFAGLPKRGDLWREIGAWQQYGQGGSILIAGVLIWLLDPLRRRRLLDWAAAGGVTWLAVFLTKVVLGRPRPKLGDPYGFLWPWGTWDFGPPVGSIHAWQIRKVVDSELWSMPSSHTALAAVMSVFLARLYPRLTGFCVVMVGVVGLARVAFGAHYPSDVLMGGALGWMVAELAVGGLWGVRGLDQVWRATAGRADRGREGAYASAPTRDSPGVERWQSG
jgi:membrane-associated phospholipid phosphatase